MPTSWSNDSRTSTSFSTALKNSTAWSNTTANTLQGFLLQETGFVLLLESGDELILDQSTGNVDWDTVTRN